VSAFSTERVDAIRAENPELGIAIYAYEPGGAVTLELISAAGETYTFTGLTLREALDAAFPTAAPEAEPEPTANIFD